MAIELVPQFEAINEAIHCEIDWFIEFSIEIHSSGAHIPASIRFILSYQHEHVWKVFAGDRIELNKLVKEKG